jgi:hypothetical protein
LGTPVQILREHGERFDPAEVRAAAVQSRLDAATAAG